MAWGARAGAPGFPYLCPPPEERNEEREGRILLLSQPPCADTPGFLSFLSAPRVGL